MKKKILFTTLSVVVAIVLLEGGALLQQNYGKNTVVQTPDLHQLLGIINQERAAIGHLPVAETQALDDSAAAHCADMVNQNYWAHVNPQGVKPQDWINAQHIQWIAYGENINFGAATAVKTASDFYDSPEHLANTDNIIFNQVGLATCSAKSFPNIVVEQFIQAP